MWWNWYETENLCGGVDSVVAVLDSVTVVMEFCYGGDWNSVTVVIGERNSVRVF
jgi:hypothetical protein